MSLSKAYTLKTWLYSLLYSLSKKSSEKEIPECTHNSSQRKTLIQDGGEVERTAAYILIRMRYFTCKNDQ